MKKKKVLICNRVQVKRDWPVSETNAFNGCWVQSEYITQVGFKWGSDYIVIFKSLLSGVF